jgi:hypothetical protein
MVTMKAVTTIIGNADLLGIKVFEKTLQEHVFLFKIYPKILLGKR